MSSGGGEIVRVGRREFAASAASGESAPTGGAGGPGGEVMYALGALVEQVRARYVGMRITLDCLYRWGRVGYRGVRLETWRVPGGLVSSVQAFDRFVRAINGEQEFHRRGAENAEEGAEVGAEKRALTAGEIAEGERRRRERVEAELGRRGVGGRKRGRQ